MVVLLAAVFAMHGIPSMAAAGGSVPAAHVEVAAAVDGVDLLPVGSMPDTGSAIAHDVEAADHGGSSQSMASHAWNACLAVLLWGIALLAVSVVRRLPASRDNRVVLRTHGSIAWIRPPRPPDLAALCLLRI